MFLLFNLNVIEETPSKLDILEIDGQLTVSPAIVKGGPESQNTRVVDGHTGQVEQVGSF